MSDLGAELGRAATEASHATNDVRTLKRRAGRAIDHAADVNRELGDACDVFAAGAWGDLDLVEIARVGRRIAARADQLIAAQKLPRALERAREANRRLREAHTKVYGS